MIRQRLYSLKEQNIIHSVPRKLLTGAFRERSHSKTGFFFFLSVLLMLFLKSSCLCIHSYYESKQSATVVNFLMQTAIEIPMILPVVGSKESLTQLGTFPHWVNDSSE